MVICICDPCREWHTKGYSLYRKSCWPAQFLTFPIACSACPHHHQQVPNDSILSFLPGTIRSPWCSCASWSPHWCPGASGERVCGIPTSWPPSSAIPSLSMSPGWSTVLPTCMETDPMTSTSALGRTHWSLWVPLVSRGMRASEENGSSIFLASCGFVESIKRGSGVEQSELGLWY